MWYHFQEGSSRRASCGVVKGLISNYITSTMLFDPPTESVLRSSNILSSSYTSLSGFLLFATQVLVQMKRYSFPWMPLIRRRIVKTQLQKADNTQALYLQKAAIWFTIPSRFFSGDLQRHWLIVDSRRVISVYITFTKEIPEPSVEAATQGTQQRV